LQQNPFKCSLKTLAARLKASSGSIVPLVKISSVSLSNLVIAHLNGADSKLTMELTITNGRGYVSSEKNKRDSLSKSVS